MRTPIARLIPARSVAVGAKHPTPLSLSHSAQWRSLSTTAASSSLQSQSRTLTFLGTSLRKNARSPTIATGSTPSQCSFLRPYHISIRSFDQHQRGIQDAASIGTTQDPTEKPSLTSGDSHIQPQQTTPNPIPPNLDPKARMLIGFTCTVCNNRSHKTMSKHAYNHGVVLMQCDHCKNRHLIADHLGWFKNGGVTVEDLVKERGETVQKLTRSYQLVKDGQLDHKDDSNGAGVGVGVETESAGASISSTETADTKPKTEFELALEKASEGMLEWIPKDILHQEEERVKKSREMLDHSKKQD